MKRALSWLLVLVMVFSMIPLAAFADETTWTEAGSYAVVADTMYVLEPAEPGVYTITAAEGALFSICNAASGFPMESDVSTYDFTVQQVGPSVGVIAAADTTINVVRTGDAPAPIEWVDYEIGYTLTPDMMPACMCLGTGDESFYLVNFNHATISLTAMLETTGANYADPDNGVYINYTNALREYVAVANSDSNPVKGYWILDNHLYQMLNHLYVAKDWGRYLDSIMDLTVEAHMEHTDVQTVTLEDGYNYEICMACESLLWTDCPGYFEDNPIMLDVVWNGAVGTATVTLEAGECGYYGARTNGATWTVNGKEPEYVYVPTFPMAPSSIWLENMTGAPMTFEIVLTMPAGTQTNPDTLVLGENSITVKEGATEYYYHYEATEDGIFTLTMPESGWFYVINNMTTGQYGDWQYSDSEPVVNPGTVEVSAGDVLEIQVNTYNPDNPWSAPAGTLTFTASMSGAGSDVPPAGSVLTLAEAIALGESVDDYTEGKYYVTGIVDDLYNTMYGNMHLIDAEGNDLVLYGMYSADGEVRYDAMDVKPVNGDTVTVYGVIGNFKGTAQMKNGWLVEHIVAEKPEAPADPEADSELTIAEAIALGESKDHNVYTENKYYVVGTVKDVYNETYGNMHIVDEDGNELTIYGSYDMDGSNRYDAMFMKPVAGDTVVLYGIIGQYNGTAQMKNGWIVDYKCGHDLTHYEAVEAECHNEGSVEYWTCSKCGGFWLDEACTRMTNAMSIYLPATGEGNVVHMEAVEPGCHYEGNSEYWICYDCEKVWADEDLTQLTNIKNVVVPAKGSNLLVHNEAIEPACHYDGCIEHWICYECNQVWTDEALTQLSNVKNVVVPATHNPEAIHVEAVAPTCEAEGNIEYWYCEECGQVWTDEALTQLSNMLNVRLPLADHELLIHMDAVEPGCHFEGNIEYWVCYACEKVWQDEALTQLTNIKNVVLPAKGSNLLVHNEAIEPGCHYDGCIEHWICYECNKVWTDEALTKLSNVKNVVLPATHDPEAIHVEAVAPGCEAEGNIEYWYCEECGQVWQDEALTQLTNIKNVILPATHNNIVHMDAVEPGCHYDGHIEHWYCADCGIVWANEGFTQVTNHKNVIIPAIGGGNVEHIEAVAPSCYANGNIEHWYCKDCGQVWQNEALTQLTNLKNVVVAAQCTNIIHIEAVEPGCHYQGNIEHWYCADCDTVWQDENRTQITNHKNVVVPELGGKVIHVAAVEATCVATGNIEYWYCEQCEQVWQDEARTQLTNFKNVITVGDHTPDKEGIRFEFSGNPTVIRSEITATYTFGCAYCDEKVEGKAVVETVVVEAPTCEETGLVNYVASVELNGVEYTSDDTNDSITNIKVPALGHDLVHIDAVAPGCHFDGNIEHWYCTGCEIVWADAELTQVTNHKNVIVPALGGEVVHVEAVEPGCEKEGNIEHWYCEECEQVWQNEALTQLTNHKNVILPAAHKNIVHIDAVAPGCHYEGNTEHWYCADCDMVWADEGLNYITNHKNVIIPATGEGKLAHIEAVAPGCHFDGNIEYWICYECEQVWQNKALTQLTNIKNVILPALGGEVVHVDAVEPGCENEGNIEHWYCEECEQVWTDEALTKLSNHLSVKLGITHNVVHMDAVKPGCHYNGNIEYWYCPDCGAHWTDELCREVTNSKNVILPATGGEVIHVPAAEPSCKEGNIEYWYCEECEQVWQNEALTQLTNFKNVLIPSKGEHALNMDNLIWSWSADKKSAEAFTYCSGCESNVVFYADVVAEAPLTATSEDHKNITTTYHYFTATVTYKGQTYTNKCVVVDPTCRHVGFTSYFGDVLIGNTVYNYPEYTKDYVMGSPWGKWEVQKKLAHQWIEEGKVGDKNYKKYCANCNLDYKNVATGDAIMTSVIIMVLAGAAVVLLLTKKRRIA